MSNTPSALHEKQQKSIFSLFSSLFSLFSALFPLPLRPPEVPAPGGMAKKRVGPPLAASFGDLWRPLLGSLLSSFFSLLSSLLSLLSSLFALLSSLFSLLLVVVVLRRLDPMSRVTHSTHDIFSLVSALFSLSSSLCSRFSLLSSLFPPRGLPFSLPSRHSGTEPLRPSTLLS